LIREFSVIPDLALMKRKKGERKPSRISAFNLRGELKERKEGPAWVFWPSPRGGRPKWGGGKKKRGWGSWGFGFVGWTEKK